MAQIPNWLTQRARLTPERLALVSEGKRWSFQELDEQAALTARRLAAAGVVPECRVALLARNGTDFVRLVHALSYLGAVLLPINTRLTPAEINAQLADADVRFLVHDTYNCELAVRVAADRPGLQLIATARLPGTPSLPLEEMMPANTCLRERVDLDEPHSIIYTSGTTGQAKGVVLTYGNHWWSAAGSALNLGHHLDDRWLASMPLFHVGGLAILLRSVIYGITAVVHESFEADSVNRTIEEEGITIISVVSTMLRRMLADRSGAPYPPSLRCILLGGGPAPLPLLQACESLRVPVVQTYGLTEAASQVATLAPEDAMRMLGSAGKPLSPTEVRIKMNEQWAGAREVGEIVVRGPTVSPGYVNSASDAHVMRDGWLHTGDLGYLDDVGYLYVLDRRSDLIITGGENVYPAEVEAVLVSHPAVADAGVVGVQDEEWGQIVVAAVTFRQDEVVPEEDLLAFCRSRLAGYKTPRKIRFVDAISRNVAGKIVRARVRESLRETL